MILALMLPLSSLTNRMPLLPLQMLKLLPLPLLIHRLLPRPRLKLRLRLKPRLLLKLVLVLLLLLPLLLVLMLLLVLIHSTLLSKNSREVSLLMFWNKDLELSARLAKPPRFNIPEPLPPTEKFSTHQYQEDSQLLSPSVTSELLSAGRMPSFSSQSARRLTSAAQLPPPTEPRRNQEFQLTPILFSTSKLSTANELIHSPNKATRSIYALKHKLEDNNI